MWRCVACSPGRLDAPASPASSGTGVLCWADSLRSLARDLREVMVCFGYKPRSQRFTTLFYAENVISLARAEASSRDTDTL